MLEIRILYILKEKVTIFQFELMAVYRSEIILLLKNATFERHKNSYKSHTIS